MNPTKIKYTHTHIYSSFSPAPLVPHATWGGGICVGREWLLAPSTSFMTGREVSPKVYTPLSSWKNGSLHFSPSCHLLVGQIKALGGPVLACGLYIWHPWSRHSPAHGWCSCHSALFLGKSAPSYQATNPAKLFLVFLLLLALSFISTHASSSDVSLVTLHVWMMPKMSPNLIAVLSGYHACHSLNHKIHD